MANIVLLSILTPYKENYNGTSALPYHLMIHRDKSIKITIYSFNCNKLPKGKIKEVEKELEVDIHIMLLPKWFIWIFKFHMLFIRLFLKYPIHNYITLSTTFVEKIKLLMPDGIWIYGEEMSNIVRQFDGFKRVHTLPDCESFYYYRMLSRRFVIEDKTKFWRCAFMYPKFLNMERHFENNNLVHYHLVGKEDAEFLKNINSGIQAHFIRHPHYEVVEKIMNSFHTSIRLLIAGQYNYYMKQDADLIIAALLNNKECEMLKTKFEITFLGKGWDKHVEALRNNGWPAKHIKFVRDYIEEIKKYDIQISPISIGTGTKGKVLDALSNGLLVIGSKYAMENIAVRNGESCVEYKQPEDIVEILKDILENISRYEEIAANGRNMILKYHGRKLVSKQMFGLLK